MVKYFLVSHRFLIIYFPHPRSLDKFIVNSRDLLQCRFIFSFQIGCLVSSLFMLAFRASESALWMGTSTFGLFMSNVFPTSVALAEQYFNVTGLSNSCLVGEGREQSITLFTEKPQALAHLKAIFDVNGNSFMYLSFMSELVYGFSHN